MYRHATRFTFAVLIFSALPVGAQTVYRCTGPDGETVFSQRPCSDSAETVTLGPTNTSEPPAAIPALRAETELEREIAAIDRRYCQEARDDLRALRDDWREFRRTGYTMADQRAYQDDEREARAVVDEMCR